MGTYWHTEHNSPAEFSSLEKVFSLQGTKVTRSTLSRLITLVINGQKYYIKRYHRAGRNLRQWVGRSRVRAEWENLLLFKSLGIPVPPMVAFGEERRHGRFIRGAVITQELKGCVDLSCLAMQDYSKLVSFIKYSNLLSAVAEYTARLHQIKFIHNDLKWRNILIDPNPECKIYFIDCPQGRRRYSFQVCRGKIKDLACLDKRAKMHLSKAQRLRFYFIYHKIDKLMPYHKREIKKIVMFHQGRE